jgi:hypothetical protein
MDRRRIAPSEVAEAPDNVETQYPGRPPTRTIVLGRTGRGRRLKIVVAGDVVVTVACRDDEE